MNTNLNIDKQSNFFVEEAYKVLRTNIQFCGEDMKVVALTSCYANEGKTTVVLNLAKSFSELKKKVLVIDADMRKSVMASRDTDATNVKGLSELLSGLNTKDECIYNTQYEGLDVLFAGRVCPNPVELLNSKLFARLIKWARNNYDYVLVDTSPLGIVIDSAVIGPLVDGVAIVVSKNVKRGILNNIIEQLNKSGSKIIGVVCNKIGKSKGKKSSRDKYLTKY